MTSIFRRLLVAGLLAAAACMVSPQAAFAFCCDFINPPTCADCNVFGCDCSNSCNCQDSCDTKCNELFNTCLITCTQSNCGYCSDIFRKCMNNCPGASLARRAVPHPPVTNFSPVRRCETVFAAMDANGDGRISKREFVAFIRAQRRMPRDRAYMTSPVGLAVMSIDGQDPRKVFNRLDKDHDGFIERAEAGIQ